MTNRKTPQNGADDLRRAAEARLEADSAEAGLPYTDLPRLVHELQVHQIELEMQNSELREARTKLEQYRDHLEDLVRQRTAEVTAAESRAQLILQSSANGLYGTDVEGRITFINPAACALLGYRPEDVIGRHAHSLFHHSKPDGSPYPVAECPCHDTRNIEQVIRIDNEVYWHADGHAIPVMYASHPMHQDGKVIGLVTSLVDMSEQRATIRAKETALIAAENLARLRSEFLANMSHEIRTPLNGVLGFAEIGARNYQDSEKALNAFNQIRASGKCLLGIINNILDFAKIEAGKIEIEQVTVTFAEVVRQAFDKVSVQVQAKPIRLLVKLAQNLPRAFRSDPLRLEQVLLNLLSNAVKFTESGTITLAVSRQGDWLEFSVADTGIGMTEAQIGQLFQPFQQADGSITRKYGGTGLGLAIAKHILELMHGDIRVESQPGVGSSFIFRIPYLSASADAQDDEPATDGARIDSGKPLAGISILVAEDNAINKEVIEELLSDVGARVALACTGREAVERIRQDGPDAYDIVLMDVEMPEMNGYEATRRILELAPKLPVIGQTAHAMEEQKTQCFDAGMIDHIAKPIDPEALVEMVLRHVVPRTVERLRTRLDRQ